MQSLIAAILVASTSAGVPQGAIRAKGANVNETPFQTIKALPFYTARIAKTPDINQHMTFEQLLKQLPVRLRAKYTPPAEIGIKSKVFFENFCGPCSVSDNLIYLKQFFPQIHDESNPVAAGTFLARNLGFNYLNTVKDPDPEDFDPPTGTGTSYPGLVGGTLKFLAEKGVKVKRATVIGYRAHESDRSEYGSPGTPIQLIQRPPTLDEMKKALHLRAIIVEHYGHYEYNPNPARLGSGQKPRPYLKRDGGHYVAPVGYGLDANGKPSEDTFIIHDPAGSGQDQQRQDYQNWFRQPRDTHRMLPLLNWRGDKKLRHPSFANADWPKFEFYGTLSETYVRDAPISGPKNEQRYEILEGLIVIEV